MICGFIYVYRYGRGNIEIDLRVLYLVMVDSFSLDNPTHQI